MNDDALLNNIKTVIHGKVETFPFVYSLVSQTCTVSNVKIGGPMIKQESSRESVRY